MSSIIASLPLPSPKGFLTCALNVGIKDNSKDLICIFSQPPCNAAGFFTKSLFAGPSVQFSRDHLSRGTARAIIAISKNANVATGPAGKCDAMEIISRSANALQIEKEDVLLCSTGVIGKRYPMKRILPNLTTLNHRLQPADFAAVAEGIMTTDTHPKYAAARINDAVVVGVAKGVGMMEPNMATLLAFFATDAEIDSSSLKNIFQRVVNKTFNCLSIDTDTSTSDSAIILANGLAGPVDLAEFELTLEKIAIHLVKAIARDGEGSSKLIEVIVDDARNEEQAKRVGKAVVNSPLVKTAIHGADPNWGRIAMAIGKCDTEYDVKPDRTVIRFGDLEVYPNACSDIDLERLRQMLRGDEVQIHISLNTGNSLARVWGCDLSREYVDLNSRYTT